MEFSLEAPQLPSHRFISCCILHWNLLQQATSRWSRQHNFSHDKKGMDLTVGAGHNYGNHVGDISFKQKKLMCVRCYLTSYRYYWFI